jgi:NAD(P)-dependent dehydrogenase (short-subunit alcohol dehydrogenase family)
MPQKGDHIVIIGGTQGLGLDIAKASTELGASVTVAGRSSQRAQEAAQSLGDSARALSCDLTDWNSLENFFDSIGSIDHLILAALDRDHNEIRSFRPDDSAKTMLMKNVGYAAAVHYALPRFTADASVVMFSGLSMWVPMPGSTTISMANGGVIGLMNSLATQVAPVRVNAITPGAVQGTNAVDNADPVRKDRYEALRQRTPGKRLPTPADIVAATFALTDNPGINGTNITVDAGMRLV